ncbi:hypothetical protein Y032_0076g1003 [Ancylostoma ceylanicum]|nr:hypothetical protein Y032_0076g1003 [Ancylostoma ceylanicum]
MISFHIISRFSSTKWELFIATTVVWELAHVMDGFIALAFNGNLYCELLKVCQAEPTVSGMAGTNGSSTKLWTKNERDTRLQVGLSCLRGGNT